MTPFVRRLAVAVLSALMLLLAVPATAHDYLVESQPGADTAADSPPTEILLRFNNEVLDVNPAVLVQDDAGSTVAEGTPAVDGTVVTLPLPGDLTPGPYTVTWRVVSSDGHPIEGQFGFEVSGAAAEAPEPTSTPRPSPTTTTPPGTEDAVIGPAEQDTSESESGAGALPTWARVVTGVAAVGAVAALVVLVVRRQRER